VVRNCFGITLELSENKWRPEADLGKLWEENKDALLQLPLVATLGGEHACSMFAWQPASWQVHQCAMVHTVADAVALASPLGW
jgi:hypothetical protein